MDDIKYIWNFLQDMINMIDNHPKSTQTWKPMNTAPRNGTEVLLQVERRAGIPGKCLVGHWMPGGHCIEGHPPIDAGWYFWNGRMFDKASTPVQWMRLPEMSDG